MAVDNTSGWGTKSARVGLVLTMSVILSGLFGFGFELDKRTSIIENNEISNVKTIERIDNNIISLHNKVDILISRFEYERGKNESN